MSVALSSYIASGILFLAQLSVGQTTLTVAAASDLTDLEPALAQQFERTNPALHVRVRFVTAASALLSEQIQNGAPYDVFLSANAQFVDRLGSSGKVIRESIRAYAVGRVGVLWSDGKRHDVKDLAQNWVRFVALPNPKLAPYGSAAVQALEHAGTWKEIQPKVVYGENVRQALELFDSGNADAVLTSASLLQGKNFDLVPADWHAPIVQKVGIVAATREPGAADQFLKFLLSPAGQAVFAQFGFGPPPKP
jgi:molybdate transport system substrate-binding protein